MPKSKNEDLQKKYLELQIIIEQISQIQQQINILQNNIFELSNLMESISILKEIKKDAESFSSLGSNIFVKTKIQDANELFVNVGSNIFVVKDLEETKLLVSSQINRVDQVIRESEIKLNQLGEDGRLLESEIMEMTNK